MRWHRLPASSHSIRVVVVLALFAAALMTGGIDAQQPPGPGLPQPRLLTIMPMGGKLGTTVEVILAGQDVEEPEGLLFSHPKIKAELVPGTVAAPDPKATPKAKVTQPTGAVKYKVTIPPDVPQGIHDVRLFNKWGVSNPRAFVVGDNTEALETEPNNDVAQAQKVELNTTINGVLNPAIDVDYFVFTGKKSQRVLASCQASSIDSRANPVVEIYSSAGKQLAGNRDYDGNNALADATLPADGEYLVRVSQFTHTVGSPEYFYRLTISTAPWIDVIYPAVIQPGKATQVTVYGRNLPGGRPDPAAVLNNRVLDKLTVALAAPSDPAAWQRLSSLGYITPPGSFVDGFEYRLNNSNPFLVTFARTPVVLDNGTNTTREAAQEVKVPCEIAARLDKKHPLGWYQFAATKGALLSIDVLSDRLGAGTDLVMGLYNADTKAVITEQDDDPETLSINQFFTKTADPARYRFAVPADGKYQLVVRSQDSTQLNPRNFYHVRIAPEQPDFRLVVMACSVYLPEAAVLRQGGNTDYIVYVWRQDNFNGDITLNAEGLPPGVTCKEQTISPVFKTGLLVLSAAPDAQPWTGAIKIKGTAIINGQPLVREARAASIVWPGVAQQPNIPLFARLDRSIALAVRDQAPFSLTTGMDKASIMQGEKVTIPLKVERHWPEAKVALQVAFPNLAGLPAQQAQNQPITVAPVTIAADKNEGNAVVDVKANVPPGNYTIVLRGTAQVPFAKDAAAKKGNANIALPFTPVVITVLPKQLGNVTVTPPNATGKLGAPVEVVVKVARMYDFHGEFKVQLVLPPDSKITAPEVTIPPGKEEAKLVINVPADAPVGNMANLVIKATAAFNATHMTTQEAKFALNVTK